MHCDLYRLNSYDEVLELGILDNLDKKILLVEWPNFLEKIIKDQLFLKLILVKQIMKEMLLSIYQKFYDDRKIMSYL